MEKETKEMFKQIKANKEKEQAKKIEQKKKQLEEENLKTKIIIGLSIGAVFLLILMLSEYIRQSDEQHIEKVSQQCAEKGYGIKARYTKEGDKSYTCNK